MKRAVLFLDRSQCALFGSNLLNGVQFAFPQNTVFNLEILDKKTLTAIIHGTIDQNKIEPSSLLLVMTPNAYFHKVIPKDPNNPQNEITQITTFTENVPFEETLTKIYQHQESTIVMATNGALIDAIEAAFKTKGFSLEIVIPFFALQLVGLPIDAIDQAAATNILTKFEQLKQPNLNAYLKQLPPSLTLPTVEKIDAAQPPETTVTVTQEQPKQDNKRIYILAGVFGFLLIILVVLLYQTFLAPKPKPIEQAKQNQTPAETPTQQLQPITPAASNSSVLQPSATSSATLPAQLR